MKKKLVLSSLAMLASFGVATAAFADGPEPITVNGGTVNFKGEITNGACAVDLIQLIKQYKWDRLKLLPCNVPGSSISISLVS
ncbi:hypothetical protein [Photobacterium leiognathi]|uniref:hypothetical protein n=1 Tax=Photobacterium leiognathi TaxID=553611 RepID=UPI00273399AF|nr:hypothetical protein [Photobacterium leiognathi]